MVKVKLGINNKNITHFWATLPEEINKDIDEGYIIMDKSTALYLIHALDLKFAIHNHPDEIEGWNLWIK